MEEARDIPRDERADADLTGFRGTDQGTQLKAGGSSGFNARLDGYMLPLPVILYGMVPATASGPDRMCMHVIC